MDLRKQRTQEKLQIALEDALKRQSLDEVTIAQLSMSAGVSRQTFYAHFENKTDLLLSKLELVFSKPSLEVTLASSRVGFEYRLTEFLHNILSECERHRPLVNAAFFGHASSRALGLLEQRFITLFSAMASADTVVKDNALLLLNSGQIALAARFYAGAVIAVINADSFTDLSTARPAKTMATDLTSLIMCGLKRKNAQD